MDTRWGKLGFIGALFGLVASVPSDIAQASHSWGPYHWKRSANPFTLVLGNNVSSTWLPYLNTTASDWGASSVVNTTITSGRTRPKSCKPSLGRVEVCSERYGNNGWLGIAQIWIDREHITQAITKVNDTYFGTRTYNTTAWRNLVMCQEVGHTLGLDHQDENMYNTPLGSCMDYSNDPAPNQHPNAHDYYQLEQVIYAHLDSNMDVVSSPSEEAPAMNEIAFEGPAQWGKLTHQGQGGRYERYELDFGHGKKVITHVIWASAFDH